MEKESWAGRVKRHLLENKKAPKVTASISLRPELWAKLRQLSNKYGTTRNELLGIIVAEFDADDEL